MKHCLHQPQLSTVWRDYPDVVGMHSSSKQTGYESRYHACFSSILYHISCAMRFMTFVNLRILSANDDNIASSSIALPAQLQFAPRSVTAKQNVAIWTEDSCVDKNVTFSHTRIHLVCVKENNGIVFLERSLDPCVWPRSEGLWAQLLELLCCNFIITAK